MTESSRVDSGGSAIAPVMRSSTLPTATTTTITTNSSSSSNNVNTNASVFNGNNHTAATNATSRPTPLRVSQTFPVGSSTASGSSSHQSIPHRPSWGLPGNGSFVRNSPSSSQSFFEASAESSAIDPLSQHIIKRTNTEKSIPLKLLGKASYEAEARGTDNFSPTKQGAIRGDAAANQNFPREKKKGVSFLSRIIGGRKKDQLSASEDDASEPDVNPHMDPDALSQPIGFIPRFPRPPKYIKVRAHFKKEKTFNRVFVAQELNGTDVSPSPSNNDGSASSYTEVPGGQGTGKAVWALGFSKDGKYLAAAGQDRKVRVWAVISSPSDRDGPDAAAAEADEGQQDDQDPPRLKAPVFRSEPVQVYEGHTGSILDLSWSKNNFLLSSSMDKTVRLWHVTRSECLCCFKHSDFVPSIQFHPRDDRFFLAGSLDTKLRLWSIPDKSVAFVATVPDMITAVAFTPDGRHSIAGCLNGLCNIYETDGLKLVGQLHVRSARPPRKVKGSKITGIDTITLPPNDPNGGVKVLITSNDSRIRLYNFRDRTLEAKFRGNENTCSQIRASFSDDGKHVICGSEDRRAYIWPTGPVEKDMDKRAVEIFDTNSSMVTAAVMAPAKTKQILGFSEDPIYDICNPPPVTLVGSSLQQLGNQRNNNPSVRRRASFKMAEESPAYLSRSTHPDGNIIISADYSGKIKVLRQDCAYQKRRYEAWDAGSTISRKLLGRSNSARHSIASSIGKDSTHHKTPSERIISWRNAVIRNERASMESSRQGTRTRTPSPHVSRYSSRGRASSVLPAESRSVLTKSPPRSARKSSIDSPRSSVEVSKINSHPTTDPRFLRPREGTIGSRALDKDNSNNNPSLWIEGDQSYLFWNKIAHDALAANSKKSPNLLSPNRTPSTERRPSATTLSSDYGSSLGEAEDGEVLKCDNCQSTNFRATRGRDGKQRLICVNCRRPIS